MRCVHQVHALCEDDSVLGRAFYVMDYVPGPSAYPGGGGWCPLAWSKCMSAERVRAGRVLDIDDMPTVSASARARIMDHLNLILAELHCVDIAAVGTRAHPLGECTRIRTPLGPHVTLGLTDHGKSGDYAKRQVGPRRRPQSA